MFSENGKISGRQLKRVLILDWMGKTVLLLPKFTERTGGRGFLLSVIIAIGITCVYAWVVGWLAGHVEDDFYLYVKERLGTPAAWFLSIVYICYAFVNAVYLVRLFAVIAVVYLLPESSVLPLMIMLVLGSAFVAAGGIEPGARVGEIIYKIILLPLAGMLFFAFFSVKPAYLTKGEIDLNLACVSQGLHMFIVFGGMGMILYVAPNLNPRETMKSLMRKAVLVTGIGTFLLLLASVGTFGADGMRALSWPVIDLMSSVEIPGGFLQRWDVVFTVLLLAGFFLSVGIALFFMKGLTERIFEKAGKLYLPLFSVLILAAACWCGTYETTVKTYVIVNGYILVPIAVIFTVFLALIEHSKRRQRK